MQIFHLFKFVLHFFIFSLCFLFFITSLWPTNSNSTHPQLNLHACGSLAFFEAMFDFINDDDVAQLFIHGSALFLFIFFLLMKFSLLFFKIIKLLICFWNCQTCLIQDFNFQRFIIVYHYSKINSIRNESHLGRTRNLFTLAHRRWPQGMPETSSSTSSLNSLKSESGSFWCCFL